MQRWDMGPGQIPIYPYPHFRGGIEPPIVGFAQSRLNNIMSVGQPETDIMNMMRQAHVSFPVNSDVTLTDVPCEAVPAERVEVLLKLLAECLAMVDQDNERAWIRLSQAMELLQPTARTPHRPLGTTGGLASWQIQRVDCFVDQHLDSPIRTPQLAKVLNLSVSHFSHAFKQTLGVAPLVYVARRRIESAREMMLASPSSLAEIALSHGFCDQSHFSRTFRRETGLTPQMWRRMFCKAGDTK